MLIYKIIYMGVYLYKHTYNIVHIELERLLKYNYNYTSHYPFDFELIIYVY